LLYLDAPLIDEVKEKLLKTGVFNQVNVLEFDVFS